MPAHLELIIFGLLVAVTSFVLLASISRVPYPVFLVVGGLALSLVPGLPAIELPPDLVFLIFLPPLLYSAAFFSSPRDLKAQIRPIALLAIGLVPWWGTWLSDFLGPWHLFSGLSSRRPTR
jgi:NhaP-type Na+/H+ or K+/H+ antiporter